MRITRCALLCAALAIAAVPLAATSAGAQVSSPITIVIRKVVTGSGAPSSVTLTCTGTEAAPEADPGIVFNFDALGNPTTVSPAVPGVDIVDGAFQLSGESGGGGTCTYEETATGGASSTSFTCDYSSTPQESVKSEQVEELGCSAASGAGTGPVDVVYGSSADVSEQSSEVVFTNTFPAAPPQQPVSAPAVVATPTFTG